MEGSGSGGQGHLGVSRMSKVVVKRTAIHHAKHHQQQQQQAAVYNIDKSDFRDVVQKLTGSPAAETAPVSGIPAPNPAGQIKPKPANPRLQRARPPPLEPVFSFSKLVPNLAPPTSSISFPSETAFGSPSAVSPPLFSPLPPLTPGDAVWANACDSPHSGPPAVLPPRHVTVPPAALQTAPPAAARWSAVQYPLPPPSPAAHFSAPSPLLLQAQGSGYIPFSGGSLFPLSPSSQFGFAGGTGPLALPLSPGSLFPFP